MSVPVFRTIPVPTMLFDREARAKGIVKREGFGRHVKYDVSQLEVGDSIFHKGPYMNVYQLVAHKNGKFQDRTFDFVKTRDGYRIWRVR